MIARIRKSLENKEQGFTLIELLVVIIIIGILAAIAIPAFLNQREKAWASQAESDLKNAAIAAESYAVDKNGSYAAMTVDLLKTNYGFHSTAGVTTTVVVDASGNAYTLTADHASLPTNYTYSSSTGVITP